MREMGLTAQNIERRRNFVGLDSDDSKRIVRIQELVEGHLEELTSVFFAFLGGIDEARPLLGNRDIIEKVRLLKKEHLSEMVRGEYGTDYIEQRVRLAVVYSNAGLASRVFLGAYHHMLRALGVLVMKHSEHDPMAGFESYMSLKKVAFLDIGIIVDVIVFERERVIRQQQEAIRELSTPVLQIRERLLLLPIIGVIDTQRARLITDSLLRSIRANRARVVVVDVTGVATIDSKVANHLLQTVTAARLMGATAIVTGISSEVAQSLVGLGIDLVKFNTVGDLQGGIEEAERLIGYRVIQTTDNGAAEHMKEA